MAFIGPGVPLNGINTIVMKNNYWGLGPKIGFSPSVLLSKRVSLFADAAVSSLFGIFHLDQKSDYLERTQFEKHSRFFGIRWVADVACGLSYQTSIFRDHYDFFFKLAYEFHEFFHQMELKRDRFHLISDNSNLKFQGGVASVRLDF